MEPTLPRGSLMVTLPFFSSSMTLARGEIVLFKNRGRADQVFTKRIIGIPGDEVSIDGPYLVINGVAVDRAKVDETSDTTTWAEKLGKKHYEIKFLKEGQRHHTKDYSVPSDSYFVMGDNRDNSNDSRYTGFVKKEWIRAKLVSVVVLPF